MKSLLCVVASCLVVIGCDKGSPTGPSSITTDPQPGGVTPSFDFIGQVLTPTTANRNDNQPASGATITMNRTGNVGDLISWEDGVYGTSKSVFPGGARACRPDGRGAPGGPRLRVGGAAVGGAEARMHAETRRKWVRQAQRDAGHRPGLTTSERERWKELEREVRELKRANEILRKASAYFAQAELDRRGK